MKLAALSAQKKQMQGERDGILQRRQAWDLPVTELDDLQQW